MKYERSIIIGRGALTDVYRGRSNNSGQVVAMKGLKDEFCVDDLANRFERDGQLGGKLSHPNIVQVLDVMRDKNRPFLILESLDGETLQSRLQRGALPEDEAIAITRQILQGLSQAHRQGIAHRDLKSSNVFLCRDGSVKIMDFGLSEVASQVERTFNGVRLRDPHYLSPEQLRGEPSDARSDIFSVGILMYEMLKGDVPFAGANARAVWQMQGRPPEPLPVWVSPATRAIILKALRKEPIARFSAASEMSAALQDPTWRDPDAAAHDDPFADAADPIQAARETAKKKAEQERARQAAIPKMSTALWLVLGFVALSLAGLLYAVLRHVGAGAAPTNRPATTIRSNKKVTPRLPAKTPVAKTPVAMTRKVVATPKPTPKPTAKPTSQPTPKPTPVVAPKVPTPRLAPLLAATPTPEELVIKNPVATRVRPRRVRRPTSVSDAPRRVRVRRVSPDRPRRVRVRRSSPPSRAPRRNSSSSSNLPF